MKDKKSLPKKYLLGRLVVGEGEAFYLFSVVRVMMLE